MRGYSAIGLNMPKTPDNVGSVLRAAHCYGSSLVAMTGNRYKNARTDPQKAYRHIPLVQVSDLKEAIPYDCIPVAIEFIKESKSLIQYTHPERAFYVFGPEDGSISKDILKWCRDIVYVPTHYCMNLAATVNVVLYDRMVKRGLTTATDDRTAP